jgi:hypothetical protein
MSGRATQQLTCATRLDARWTCVNQISRGSMEQAGYAFLPA